MLINRVIRESIGVAYPAIAETKLATLDFLRKSIQHGYFAEQQEILKYISDYIQKKSVEIDQAITRAQREIELIQEYRIRLISDVVTGQVDVRGIEASELAGKALPPLDEGAGKSDYDNSGRESILGEEGIKP